MLVGGKGNGARIEPLRSPPPPLSSGPELDKKIFLSLFQINASKQRKHSITITENGKLNA